MNGGYPVARVDLMNAGEPGCEPKMPTKQYPGDAGWDLYASRPLSLLPGHTRDLHTDIRVALPEGYFGRIMGRSSTLPRHGVIVVDAVIDQGYRGELFVQVHNPAEEFVHLEQGIRVAQLVVLPIPQIRWMAVEEDDFPSSPRGDNAFGSTGE